MATDGRNGSGRTDRPPGPLPRSPHRRRPAPPQLEPGPDGPAERPTMTGPAGPMAGTPAPVPPRPGVIQATTINPEPADLPGNRRRNSLTRQARKSSRSSDRKRQATRAHAE